MKNEYWKGKKRVHEKLFMGIDKKTHVQYTSCEHCDNMWADGKKLTKKEIKEYEKRKHEEFNW